MPTHKRGMRIVIGKEPQTLTAQEMQQKEILRLTRKMVRLEDERRRLRRRLTDISNELRVLRRAQKIVLAPVFQPDEFDSAAPPAEKDTE